MKSYDIVIVGGGPAGLAAAASAKENGIDSVLILERDRELGGILNQCIHNGFGLHTFKEELTGPEYAGRFIEQVKELDIEYKLNTMVMDISAEKVVTAMTEVLGCDGYNVLQNNGEAAGQTVFHFHMHLIPRYDKDNVNIKWKPGTLKEEWKE